MNQGHQPPSRSRAWVGAFSSLLALWGWLASGGFAAGHAGERENPNRVKAAFIRNFAHYVKWPTTVFAGPTAPWTIGVVGDADLGEVLKATLRGRAEQGRTFQVHTVDSLTKLPPCHIVIVALEDSRKRRAALSELKDKPVLTIGDAADTLKDGGIIRFQLSDRIQMSVNLDQARAVALVIPTEMLEVSTEVLEHGVVRRMR